MNPHASIRIIQEEHHALAALLQSLHLLVRQGPQDDERRFFDTLRAMLFYIDEFPERLHHPKESELLFPRVAKMAPELRATIDKLEQDHVKGESAVRKLQHLLLAWELLGESRRQAFLDAFNPYMAFYREHMRLEETEVLPAAQKHLTADEWLALDAAFTANRDPLTGKHPAEPEYEQLFKHIVNHAPAPIGLGG
jgi:hemerythrin-like domain-containing protein